MFSLKKTEPTWKEMLEMQIVFDKVLFKTNLGSNYKGLLLFFLNSKLDPFARCWQKAHATGKPNLVQTVIA